MTAETRAQLYTHFENGDKPTQQQFRNLIDSSLNIAEASAQIIASDVSALGSFSVSGKFTTFGQADMEGPVNINGATIISSALYVAVSAPTNLSGNVTIVGNLVTSANANIAGSLAVSGNASVAGNVTVSGAFTPASGITGVANNSNAAAGKVGEYISSTVLAASAVALRNTSAANITNISLTAGDWDVVLNAAFTGDSGTTVLSGAASISTISSTCNFTNPDRFSIFSGANDTLFQNSESFTTTTGPSRVSVSASTAVYFVARGVFLVSAMSSYGTIAARRVR